MPGLVGIPREPTALPPRALLRADYSRLLVSLACVVALLASTGAANGAGVIGEPRTIDIAISGSTKSSVTVNECWGWRPTNIVRDECQVIGTCDAECSLPVDDTTSFEVVTAYGTSTRLIRGWLFIEASAQPGFGVVRIGSSVQGMRHKNCLSLRLSANPTTCLFALDRTSLQKPFEVEFAKVDELIPSVRNAVMPIDQTSSINSVKLNVRISRLFEPYIGVIVTECRSADGASTASTNARAPFAGRIESASARKLPIRIRNLRAGTTYRCSLGIRPAALGAKELHFSVGTTGGSSSGGGSSGGSGAPASTVDPIEL